MARNAPGNTPRNDANAKARAFLAAYRLTASITEAAAAAKIERTIHYRWLEKSEQYRRDFAAAKDEAAQVLEDEAVRRATVGVLEPVFYQGQKCGVVRRFSDGMLQFLLRGFNPQKYSSKAEITGPGGGPLEAAIQVSFVDAKPTED